MFSQMDFIRFPPLSNVHENGPLPFRDRHEKREKNTQEQFLFGASFFLQEKYRRTSSSFPEVLSAPALSCNSASVFWRSDEQDGWIDEKME